MNGHAQGFCLVTQKLEPLSYSIKNSTKKVLLSLLWSHFRISSTDLKEPPCAG